MSSFTAAPSRKPRICVIGSLNVDFTTSTQWLPAPGETVRAQSFSINAGGKGANQAVACGRAASKKDTSSVDVEMIGAVGKDDPYYERLLKPTMVECGVKVDAVVELEEVQTGTASITVHEGTGENTIMVVPGANYEGMKDWEDIVARMERSQGKHDQPSLPDVVVLQGEIPRETVVALIDYLAKASPDTKIIFNPAPVYNEGIPGTTLKDTSILVVNETEFYEIANEVDNSIKPPPWDIRTLAAHAVVLRNRQGIQAIIVTLGAKGAFYAEFLPGAEVVFGPVPSLEVDHVVDTTAAGDTFVGYLAVALAKSVVQTEPFDFKKAVEWANAASAKTVQKKGAMHSIPWSWEV